ncbi:MAG TPA: coniferyl-alcohol dehydrogenase [Solirubrobacteraceae bacterium]|nr:coniferyl-alcohol dehydrogenase [Solirubrobacteraceae bacterium]
MFERALRYDAKRVIVSGGGGSGMGAAVVDQLSELGAEVHVFDLKEPSRKTAGFHRVDLSDPDAISEAVEGVGGAVDALFNCVGVPGRPAFDDLTTMIVNFVAVRHLTEMVVERMPNGGAVATIASTAGVGWEEKLPVFRPLLETTTFDDAVSWCREHPEDIEPGYIPAKQAIVAWTHYACNELGARGIRINCTMPGPTETPMLPSLKAKVVDGFWEAYPIPLGRFQTPDEQAAPLVFLNSAGASAITGSALITDGGSIGAAAAGAIELPPLKRGAAAA